VRVLPDVLTKGNEANEELRRLLVPAFSLPSSLMRGTHAVYVRAADSGSHFDLFVGLPTPAYLTSIVGRHEFLDVSTHDVCFKHREIFI